jgi:translation initiation factor IF-3
LIEETRLPPFRRPTDAQGPNQGPAGKESSTELRVNRRIRVPRVLVIDDSGERLGEFMTEDALRLAQERGLDLVEVAPTARPPVCRITDFGRMKYEKKKKESVARRNQVQVQLKEVKLRPKTDEHDFEFKVRHARRFLEEGNKVKVTVRFRGREMAHRNIGEEQCMEFFEAVKDLGVVELLPRMEGRQMFMIISPLKKKVPKPIVERPPRPDGGVDEEEEEIKDDYSDLEDMVDDDTEDEEDEDDVEAPAEES